VREDIKQIPEKLGFKFLNLGKKNIFSSLSLYVLRAEHAKDNISPGHK
jgi:hypothetical protein